MPAFVLDTGILIRHLRRRRGFRALMERLAREGDLIIASFTRLEVIRGMRNHERDQTMLLLNSLVSHALDIPTADLAGEFIRTQLARKKTIAGPDAVVGATAIINNAVLITTNPVHFALEGLNVYAVDEEGAVRSYRSPL